MHRLFSGLLHLAGRAVFTADIGRAVVRLLHLARSRILRVAVLLTGSGFTSRTFLLARSEFPGAVIVVAEFAFDCGSEISS